MEEEAEMLAGIKKLSFEARVRRFVSCCSCGSPMRTSKHINMVNLDKEATWENPYWGNVLVQKTYPEKRALAIICDSCVDQKREPVNALEVQEKGGVYQCLYHLVKDLRTLPPIVLPNGVNNDD